MSDSIKRNTRRACAFLAIFAMSAPASAQPVGVAAHIGTMGLGAGAAVSVRDNVALRVDLNYFPFDVNYESSGIDYNLELPSPQFLLLADFYPVGAFRLSGGVMISASDFEGEAELVEPVEIGNTVYAPSDIGNLTGTFATQDIAPYIGIGFGNPARGRIGFFLDLGVAFHGEPEVSAEADGPIASLPGFQQDLDAEVQTVQDDVEDFIVYPVLSLGISFKLGL